MFEAREAAQLAAGSIEAIVNILLAGTLAQATKGDLVVAGLVQESHEQVSGRLAAIEGKIGGLSPNEIVTQAITEKAQAALDLILPRRSLPTVDARAEIASLAGRLDNEGDLRFCAKPVQAQIYLWAARLHAQTKDKTEMAPAYRAKALSIDAAAGTEIIDAWLSANSGDVFGALARLRDVNTSDGRSNDRAMRVFVLGHPGRFAGSLAEAVGSSSQLTPRWRGESAANSSLKMAKFPASREFTGKFIDSGLGGASETAKKGMKSVSYGPIPYAS